MSASESALPKNRVTNFAGKFSVYFQLFNSKIFRERNPPGVA